MNAPLDTWNPNPTAGPAGNVMPYTQGVNTTNDPGAESATGTSTIPAFMASVPGNTDTGANFGG